MGVMDLFWIFFMLAALQPALRQRMLEAARQRLIAKIERDRASRVIALVHRQETMSLLGFPVFRYIDINDSEEILRAVDMTDPNIPIDLILHTPGGLVLAATQIARAIQNRPGKVTVFVPHYAMSGGTLIALAADEIVMCPHAVLGPVDPQLGPKPAASVVKVLEKKPVEKVDDETIILADQGEKAIRQVRQTVRSLLVDHMGQEQADRIAARLSEGTWTHDFPITIDAARELGLPVSDKMPPDILKLMALYPQPVRRQPSVEYLPIPRRGAPGEKTSAS